MEDLRLMNRTANLAERRRKPRSASNSSTSRYEREKRRYHPTASRMTSDSNCRHLNKSQTEEARRSIRQAYHGMTSKLQHFLFEDLFSGLTSPSEGGRSGRGEAGRVNGVSRPGIAEHSDRGHPWK